MLKGYLAQLGITGVTDIQYNLSYDEFFKHETDPSLEGNARGVVTELGAVNVDTGKYTGRSPKDKYFVDEPSSNKNVWWAASDNGSDNRRMTPEAWQHVKGLSVAQLSGKKLYVMDGFCGTNADTRIAVRLVTEIAWMAHFFKNMFIRPTDAELKNFKPDWVVLNACKTSCKDFQKYGLRTEVFGAFNIAERMTCIGGTWYGGEIKKGIFTMMNYFLPLKGVGSFHCSANMGDKGDTALFFGLSGTGKTTLSADPKRKLIGDDEHGWDNAGVFNFEGGCYAKCINLSKEKEPDIYHAIKRNAILENLMLDDKGRIDFESEKKTENTRASYPIDHIQNIVTPVSRGGHPTKIIFLSCDAYGVLPPVARLSKEQAMYHFLSGYTAKLAGTELGVTEPQATFSSCFGQAFLALHPIHYAKILAAKMAEHGATAYAVNTGWVAGKYGVGYRMDIVQTRAIIDAILNGELDRAEHEIMPIFNVELPKKVTGVDSKLLNPRNCWADKAEYDTACRNLGAMFVKNFKKFEDDPAAKRLVAFGPTV
ncbi:MAG: phosphoenolpyruvate carboxykinase (ATP) [Candidatus Omnitrophica bacterium]|nr:phosphoenolpyruvate carboxykinase (ATP) [Candidatus Omnitrophota bacterium]